MNIEQDKGGNSLRSSQEPHQREEMDQAESASRASFTLEPEKGLTPEPDEYNKGAAQENIKQADGTERQGVAPIGATDFDADTDTELNEDENTVTPDDLQALGGTDENVNTEDEDVNTDI